MTGDAAALAIGLGARLDVVAPAHVMPVQQIGQIGPRVIGVDVRRGTNVRRVLRPGDVRLAAERVGRRQTACRPLGHHPQMRRQAPARDRLEQVILEHEPARVRPVVRDLALIVVAHRLPRRPPQRLGGAGWRRGPNRADGRDAGEAVHTPVVEIVAERPSVVPHIEVGVVRIVRRSDAVAQSRDRKASGRPAAPPRDAIRSRERAEVVIERPVLLHDDHHVADLVDAARRPRRRRPSPEQHGSGDRQPQATSDLSTGPHRSTLLRGSIASALRPASGSGSRPPWRTDLGPRRDGPRRRLPDGPEGGRSTVAELITAIHRRRTNHGEAQRDVRRLIDRCCTSLTY